MKKEKFIVPFQLQHMSYLYSSHRSPQSQFALIITLIKMLVLKHVGNNQYKKCVCIHAFLVKISTYMEKNYLYIGDNQCIVPSHPDLLTFECTESFWDTKFSSELSLAISGLQYSLPSRRTIGTVVIILF